eukprot:11180398-Karenia_brevis.AAC.1
MVVGWASRAESNGHTATVIPDDQGVTINDNRVAVQIDHCGSKIRVKPDNLQDLALDSLADTNDKKMRRICRCLP